ncbi:MAG: cupredoxin domain-containing protein [Methanobacterium sp.]
MDRRFLALIIIIIVIIIAAAAYLYAQSSNQNQPVVNNTTGISNANNTTSNNTVATVIAIRNGSFNPNNVTVKSGTNVQWINEDNITHQIVSDNGQLQSSILSPGDSWNFFFAKTGVFGYHCGYHPRETGTVIVSQ